MIGRSQGKASLWDSKENKQLSSQPTKVASSQGSQFNGYVLGLPWEPGSNLISMHMGVNLSAKKQKVRLGDEITLDMLGKINDVLLTRRIMVSQIYSLYDPLGLLTPIMLKYKLIL